jgi:hypothetical protein
MTEEYGPKGSGEVFKYSLFLVLGNRAMSCMIAIAGLVVSPISSNSNRPPLIFFTATI